MTFSGSPRPRLQAALLCCAATWPALGWAAPARLVFAGVAARGDAAEEDVALVQGAVSDALAKRGVLHPLVPAKGGDLSDPLATLADVEELARTARAQFDEADWDACIRTMERARNTYDSGPALVTSSAAMADGMLLLAQCMERSGDKPRARALYVERVSRWPDFPVDENAFPPAVVEAVQLARAQVESNSAVLEVNSDPGGARVLVDGVPRGSTPMTYKVGPGAHTLFVQGDTGEGRAAALAPFKDGKGRSVNVELVNPVDEEMSALRAALSGSNQRGASKAAGDLLARAGAERALGGVLVPPRGKQPGYVALATWSGVGDLVHAATVEIPAGGDMANAGRNAAELLLERTPGDEPVDEDVERLFGRGGGGSGGAKTSGDRPRAGGSRASSSSSEGGRGGAAKGPAISPVVLLGGGIAVAVPVAVVLGLAVLAVGAGGIGGVVWLVVYPPNPNGTDVVVDGRKLGALR